MVWVAPRISFDCVAEGVSEGGEFVGVPALEGDLVESLARYCAPP